jgi:hypothetical protein
VAEAVKAVQDGPGDGECNKTADGSQAGTPPEKAPALAFRHQVTHQACPQRRGEVAARIIDNQADDQQCNGILRE